MVDCSGKKHVSKININYGGNIQKLGTSNYKTHVGEILFLLRCFHFELKIIEILLSRRRGNVYTC